MLFNTRSVSLKKGVGVYNDVLHMATDATVKCHGQEETVKWVCHLVRVLLTLSGEQYV